MTRDEAINLYWTIYEKYKHLQPETRRIGNGEWIVLLAAVDYFIWSISDWRQYRRTSS